MSLRAFVRRYFIYSKYIDLSAKVLLFFDICKWLVRFLQFL